mmetsp:Transcript_30909/g.35495  ORF Transcript_30909/g.35495 Transcript_30909/m.35495 type:complete len:702 (-) Transcript_30909:294-2399(-)
MKKWIVVALVAASVFKCLPVSSASSSTMQTDTKQLIGLSSKVEKGDDDAEVADGKKKKQRSSWQFYKRNNESKETSTENDATGGEGTDDDDKEKKSLLSTEKEGQKKRFQFQFLRREKELDGKDSKKKNDDELIKEEEDDGEKTLDEENKNEQGEANEPDIVDENDNETNKESSSSSDKENDDEDDVQSNQDDKENDSEEAKSTKDLNATQQYRKQLRMTQQLAQPPGTIIYRSVPSSQRGLPPPASNPSPIPTTQGQVMAAAALVNLLSLASRFFFIKWIIKKLAFESESMSPVQHFMWECLNDKFVKDNEIWNRVVRRVPYSMDVSQRKWGKTVKAMCPDFNQNKQNNRQKKRTNTKGIKSKELEQNMTLYNETNPEQQQLIDIPPETSRTVVVMDFTTMNVPDPDFLRFADVVTFLVGSNSLRKQFFGKNPEVVLILQSPGGEVTSFAFAAAQVARLQSAGFSVTVSVDRIAASGGYMIASQATQILASPFAMVGSIGVITESLNFYEALKKYGVQSLVLKAGDMKNPISQYGEVTKEDIKNTQDDLEEIHQSFIDLCRVRRPTLDLAVCNGRILSGDKALEKGMIDRILTSDEYILEKISEGDLVMKLHLVSGRNNEHNMIARALELLPHLSRKFQNFMSTNGGRTGGAINVASEVGKRKAIHTDNNAASKVVQVVGLACMVRRAIARTDFFDFLKN